MPAETVIGLPNVWPFKRRPTPAPMPEPEAEKSNPVQTVIATQSGISTRPWDAETYARLPQSHATIMSCVGIVSQSMPLAPVDLYQGHTLLQKHPILDLLKRPNPMQGYYGLMESTTGFLDLHGNAYWLVVRGPDMAKMLRELGHAIKAGLPAPDWDSFVEKAASRSTIPRELYSLRPDRVEIVPDPKIKAKAYNYYVSGTGATAVKPLTFAPEDVVHFSYWNPNNDLYGLSRIGSLEASLTLDFSRLKYQQSLFDNDGTPRGLLSSDQQLSNAQLKDMGEQWQAKQGGPKSAGKIAVLGSGLSFQTLGVPPRDMEFIVLARYTDEQICGVFRVPPMMLGNYEHATLNNFREATSIFWQLGIGPRCEKIDEALDAQFLPQFGDDLDIEFDWQSMVPRDDAARGSYAHQRVIDGTWTQNEARHYLGDGEEVDWGNIWWAPQSLYPVTDDQKEPPPPPPAPIVIAPGQAPPAEPAVGESAPKEPAPDESAPAKNLQTKDAALRQAKWRAADGRRIFGERLVSAMARREFTGQESRILTRFRAATGGKRLQKLGVESIVGLFPYTEEVAKFLLAARPVIRQMVEHSGQESLSDLTTAAAFNLEHPRARNLMATQEQRFATTVNDTTWQQLRSSLAEGIGSGENLSDLEARIGHVFEIARGSRTELIARTESMAAYNGGADEAYWQAIDEGIPVREEWITTMDGRERDDHAEADGQIVDVGQPFDVGGEQLQYPGDPNGSPENVCQCRCVVAPVVE